MAINKKLIFWKSATFNPPTSSTDTTKDVLWSSIVFFGSTAGTYANSIWTHGQVFSAGTWGTNQTNYVPLAIGNTTYNLSKDGHTHSYLPLSGGTLTGQINLTTTTTITTPQANTIALAAKSDGLYQKLSTGVENKLSIDGHTHSYLPLTGGTLTGDTTFNTSIIANNGIKHSNSQGVVFDTIAMKNNASIPSGYIKFVTPIKAAINQMFSIDIVGYDYNAGKSIDFTVVGYAYSGTDSVINIGFSNRSSFNRQVRIVLEDRGLGYRQMVIALGAADGSGTSSQTWYFQKFSATIRLWGGGAAIYNTSDFSWVNGETTLSAGYWQSSNINNQWLDGQVGSINTSGVVTATSFVGALTGNATSATTATTATKLSTTRTFALTGDVTGTITSDLTSGFSIATTIAPNSVALGTDTTGNYAASIGVSGNGLTITGTAGEGTTFTVNSNATSLNTASTLVFRDASGNFSAGTITAALSGNATTATTALNTNILNVPDTRSVNDAPSDIPNRSITAFFKTASVVQSPPVSTGSGYAHILNMNGYNSGNSGGGGHTTQLAFGDSLAIRQSTSTSAWGAWTRLALVTDNVASATKLQNTRTIWGQSFDGSGNVTGALSGATTGVFSSTVQATTAILTNLTTNYLPKHTAIGLVNSSIYDSNGNIILGGTSFANGHTPSKLNILGDVWIGDYNSPQTLCIEGNIKLKMFDSTIGGIKYNNVDGVNGGVTLQYRQNAISTSLQDGLTLNYKGNVGIGTADPSNKLTLLKSLGTNDYTFAAQHNLQFRILNYLGTYQSRALEIGLLDNGTGVIQANESGVGYNSLSLNPAGGNVGIGTTSPQSALDIKRDYGADVEIKLSQPGSAIWSIKNTASTGLFSIGTGGALSFNIVNANGNVGIGTTSPIAKLEVSGGNIVVNRPSNKVDNSSVSEFPAFEINNSFASGQAGYVRVYYPSYNNLLFGADYDGHVGGTSPNIQFGRNGNPYLTVVNNGIGVGNVGIGTTNPFYNLDVVGTINASTSIMAPTFIGTSTNASALNSKSSTYYTDYDERTLGNSVNFNNITYDFQNRSFIVSPVYPLNYTGQTNTPFTEYGQMITFGGLGTAFPFQLAVSDAGKMAFRSKYRPTNNTVIDSPWWSIYHTGNSNSLSVDWAARYSYAVGFYESSDIRLKTNIKELDPSLAANINLVEFDKQDKHGYGVIAQEVEQYYPTLVIEDADGYKTVNYTELAMIKIKYLEEKIKELERKIKWG